MSKSLWGIGKQTLIAVVGAIITIGSVAWIGRTLDEATKLHWFLGLISAVVVMFLIFVLLKWIRSAPLTRRNFGMNPKTGLFLNLLWVVVLAMVAMATISNILYGQGVISYSSSQPITAGRLLDYYSWHLIDSIPIMQIWTAFPIEAPAQGEGFWAGFLLLSFRVLVIGWSVAIFRSKQ